VGDIDFKVISAAENSNQFPKTRFWKEKSFEQQGSKMGDNKPLIYDVLIHIARVKQNTHQQVYA
jgi:hypothetical protein